MGEDTDDFWKAMGLEHVQEFKRFLSKQCVPGMRYNGRYTYHLEAERSVNHAKNEVDNFANVDHRIEVIVTLDKGEPP